MPIPGQCGLKVVARMREGKLVKGYLDQPCGSFENFIEASKHKLPESFRIQPMESNQEISVRVDTLKALFFVKSFEGKRDYPEVKFFDRCAPIRGLWVRVQFFDSECLEGTVENSIDHLLEHGFFMKPPDPQSNNEILYVIKSALTNFRVLGVRSDY